ncbi:hypothetical protein GCM10027406_13820 [Leifsonia lichenia]
MTSEQTVTVALDLASDPKPALNIRLASPRRRNPVGISAETVQPDSDPSVLTLKAGFKSTVLSAMVAEGTHLD